MNSKNVNIGKLVASLGLDDEQFKIAMAKAEAMMNESAKSMSQSFEKVGKSMTKAGKTMTAAFTLPLAAVGAGAFKVQKDFESSMSKIQGLVGVSRRQLDAWEKDLEGIGVAAGKGPKELADALFFITSSGIKGAEAMDVLNKSAKASMAGLGETKTVADLATSAMNAYGSKVLTAGKAMDVLTAAVREGKAEPAQLAASLGQVLPIASAMKVSFDQVGAAVAAMTRTGTDASTASIQLRQILASLLKPTKEAEDQLTKMGTSTANLRAQIREKGLFSVLLKLNKLTKEYGEDTLAKVFPNIRALSGVLDVMGANAEENQQIFEKLKDSTGSFDKAVQAASDTTEHAWNEALAQAQFNLLEIGKSLKGSILPLLKGFTDTLKDMNEWWKGLNDTQQKTILIMGSVAAAAGPVLIVTGTLVKNLPKLIDIFKVLNKVMLANPYVAVAAGLTALVTAIVLAQKHTDVLAESQKRAQKITDEATEATRKQQDQLFALQGSLQVATRMVDANKEAVAKAVKGSDDYKIKLEALKEAEDKRAGVIKKINSEFGEYLQGEIDIKDTYGEIETKLAGVNEKLQERIKLEALQSQSNQAYQDLINIQKQIIKNEDTLKEVQTKQRNETQAGMDKLYQSQIDNLQLTLTYDKANYDKRLEEYNKYKAAAEKVSKDIFTTVTNNSSDSKDEVIFDISEMRKNYEALKASMKGIDISTNLDKSNTDSIKNITGDVSFKIDTTSLDKLPKSVEVLNNLTSGLKEATLNEKVLGNAFNEVGTKTDLYKAAIKSLIADGYEKNKTVIEALIEDMYKLANVDDPFSKLAEGVQTYGNMAKDILNSVSSLYSAQKDREIKIAERTAQQKGKSEQWLADRKEQIEREFARKQKNIAVAQAIINVAEGVTKAIAQGGLLGIITGAIVAAKGAIEIATIKAQKFSKGGKVPSGYPNDTYPALLTSGEEVRPALPLDQVTAPPVNERLVAEIGADHIRILLLRNQQKLDRTT